MVQFSRAIDDSNEYKSMMLFPGEPGALPEFNDLFPPKHRLGGVPMVINRTIIVVIDRNRIVVHQF